ncbi:ANTAR domain-containing protein [Streptomyces monticola]|uniref:ANTAR domain-containing protein n=1 Tax=Streptomyces monticola TaxID=2666263 RepID=A0ABW2JSM8_9ACTN
MTLGGSASESAARAWSRAARARARAADCEEAAARQELLAERTGREIHRETAAGLRRMAGCHRSAARIHESFARRMVGWSEKDGDRPLFMTGVAEACGARSAALTLIGADQSQLAVAASDQPSRAAQELEFLLGEGPAIEATRVLRPVYATGAAVGRRWPEYAAGLAALGLTSVAALPLQSTESCIGALAVFDAHPGLLTSPVFIGVADALTSTVLLSPDPEPDLYGDTDHRAAVHQAAGMVSVQARCSVPDALDLIKARAFADGQSTQEVAARVVGGEITLT